MNKILCWLGFGTKHKVNKCAEQNDQINEEEIYYEAFYEKDISELIGKNLVSVELIYGSGDATDALVFTTVKGEIYKLTHQQSCCEDVHISDITGELSDLVGPPILTAEVATNFIGTETINRSDRKSGTWTFYKFSTRKGYVDIRWWGESTGYYSEEVDFGKIVKCRNEKYKEEEPSKEEEKLKVVYTMNELIALKEREEYMTMEIETLRKKHDEIINSGNVAKIKE